MSGLARLLWGVSAVFALVLAAGAYRWLRRERYAEWARKLPEPGRERLLHGNRWSMKLLRAWIVVGPVLLLLAGMAALTLATDLFIPSVSWISLATAAIWQEYEFRRWLTAWAARAGPLEDRVVL